jgi:hypothetical protein
MFPVTLILLTCSCRCASRAYQMADCVVWDAFNMLQMYTAADSVVGGALSKLWMQKVADSVIGGVISKLWMQKVADSVVWDAFSLLWMQKVADSVVWDAFSLLWMPTVTHHAAGGEYWDVPRWGLPTRLKSEPRSVAIHPTSVCTLVRAIGCRLPRYCCCCCCAWGILSADYTPWYPLIVDTAAPHWVVLPVPPARGSGLRPDSPYMGSTRRRDQLRSLEVLGYGRIGRDRVFWLPWNSFPRPPVGVPEITHLCSPRRTG